MSRRKRYSTEQIIVFLREAEVILSQGHSLGDRDRICRQLRDNHSYELQAHDRRIRQLSLKDQSADLFNHAADAVRYALETMQEARAGDGDR